MRPGDNDPRTSESTVVKISNVYMIFGVLIFVAGVGLAWVPPALVALEAIALGVALLGASLGRKSAAWFLLSIPLLVGAMYLSSVENGVAEANETWGFIAAPVIGPIVAWLAYRARASAG